MDDDEPETGGILEQIMRERPDMFEEVKTDKGSEWRLTQLHVLETKSDAVH